MQPKDAEIKKLRGALQKIYPMIDWMPYPDCEVAENLIRDALGYTPVRPTEETDQTEALKLLAAVKDK
jgi:hypothetical protein